MAVGSTLAIPPIQMPSTLSNIQTPEDLQRFSSAWISQLTTIFNERVFPTIAGNAAAQTNFMNTFSAGSSLPLNVVLANTSAATNMVILRGTVRGDTGATLCGEGFTISGGGSATITITFTTAFGSRPSIVVVSNDPDGAGGYAANVFCAYATATSAIIKSYSLVGAPQQAIFSFIIEGPKA